MKKLLYLLPFLLMSCFVDAPDKSITYDVEQIMDVKGLEGCSIYNLKRDNPYLRLRLVKCGKKTNVVSYSCGKQTCITPLIEDTPDGG